MFAIPLISGPVFVPSKDDAIEEMIKLAKITPKDVVADPGSGDGKILIVLAQRGIEAHGYEISPTLVAISKRRIKKLGLEKKAFTHFQPFESVDFSQFTVLTMYAGNLTMQRLEQKIMDELPMGARIVSNTFTFPNWPLQKKVGNIYLYQKDQQSIKTLSKLSKTQSVDGAR